MERELSVGTVYSKGDMSRKRFHGPDRLGEQFYCLLFYIAERKGMGQ